MHSNPDLIYHYDGSFDGLLCCIFESYAQGEIPLDIIAPDVSQPQLFAGRPISTDQQKAGRVLASIPKKLGPAALNFVRQAFLTCLPQKELCILLFLRLGYRYGPPVMSMLTNDIVNKLFKAVRHLERESQQFKGFLRFSALGDVLVAEMEPKNFVLPLITQHFSERYPEERFLIYDKTHGMGLVYQPYKAAVIPIDALEIPAASEEEHKFRQLWRTFYDTIAIKERYNPRCRMSHMPKRYWRCMTEFEQPPAKAPSQLPDPGLLQLASPAAKKLT